MSKRETVSVPEPRAGASTSDDPGGAEALVAAIRRPLDALDGAAEEAARGMLGRAKLGLLVAANGLIDALNAVDAEFARQHRASTLERIKQESDHRPDAHGI